MDDATIDLSMLNIDDEQLLNDTADEDEAEVLLAHARGQSSFLQPLEQHDVEAIAKHLTVLSFEEGETIMVKGGPAPHRCSSLRATHQCGRVDVRNQEAIE